MLSFVMTCMRYQVCCYDMLETLCMSPNVVMCHNMHVTSGLSLKVTLYHDMYEISCMSLNVVMCHYICDTLHVAECYPMS